MHGKRLRKILKLGTTAIQPFLLSFLGAVNKVQRRWKMESNAKGGREGRKPNAYFLYGPGDVDFK